MSKNIKTSKSEHKRSEQDARKNRKTEKEKEKERLENLVPSFIESSNNARSRPKKPTEKDISKIRTHRETVSLDRRKTNVQHAAKVTPEESRIVARRFSTTASQKSSSKAVEYQKSTATTKSSTKVKTVSSKGKDPSKPTTRLKTNQSINPLSQKSLANKRQPASQLNSKATINKKEKTSEVKKHRSSSNKPNRNGEDEDYIRPTTSTLRKGSVVLETLRHIENSSTSGNYASNPSNNLEDVKQVNNNPMNDKSDDNASSYEEDFEDYDSDFEDSAENSISESNYSSSDSDSGSQDILKNIEHTDIKLSHNVDVLEENQQREKVSIPNKKTERTFLKMSDRPSLMTENSNIQTSFEGSSMKMSHSFINFASAVEKQEKEKSMNRVLKRALELLEIITLDQNSFELINIPPMKYDIYIRTFGQSNTKQAFVQSENYDDETVQTDDIDIVDKWTQYPPHDQFGCGGSNDLEGSNNIFSMESLFSIKDVKLTTFLQNASSVVIDLLNERFSSLDGKQVTNSRKTLFYSDGYYTLTPFLKGVPIMNMSCSSESSHYIISVHDNISKLTESFTFPEEKGVICVWNILDSEKPESVLVTNSQPVCACFGPDSNNIVISGTVDGAVMLWDLTELSSKHLQLKTDDGTMTLRSPTYNTASVVGANNHHSCIVAVKVVNNWNNVKSQQVVSNTDFSKSFHIFTLEDMGVLNVWVVVEILKPDISGLGSDLGLSPGGKLSLIRSSTIILHSLHTLNKEIRTGIRTFDFRIVPSDSNRILVTTDVGLILHVARHDGDTDPRFYSGDFEFTSEIRCIDCSPHNDFLFLVGCSDGSARLYSTHSVRPLMTFPQAAEGESVLLLQWSTIHPSVFCVLSNSSQLYFWDLMQNVHCPVHSYHFTDARVTWFTMSNSSCRASSQTATDGSQNLLISKDNGEIEIHTYRKKINEKEYLQQLDFMKKL